MPPTLNPFCHNRVTYDPTEQCGCRRRYRDHHRHHHAINRISMLRPIENGASWKYQSPGVSSPRYNSCVRFPAYSRSGQKLYRRVRATQMLDYAIGR